jgi:hypothetical protein
MARLDYIYIFNEYTGERMPLMSISCPMGRHYIMFSQHLHGMFGRNVRNVVNVHICAL